MECTCGNHNHTSRPFPSPLPLVTCTFVAVQEQSLLADLRAVVARALSGLDMFSGGDLSPTAHALGGNGLALSSSTAMMPPPTLPQQPASGADAGTPLQPLPASISVSSLAAIVVRRTSSGGVVRRATVMEGMYSGLMGRPQQVLGNASRQLGASTR